MSKRTSPEQQEGNNTASIEVNKRRKLVDEVEKLVEHKLSKVKEDLIDGVLEKLEIKERKEADGESWTRKKVKHIHFVGTWISARSSSKGRNGVKPIHYLYWGWDEKRVNNILDAFRRVDQDGVTLVRKPEIESSSSSSDEEVGHVDYEWRKEVMRLTVKGVWCLFLECMLGACDKDRRRDIPEERMLLFKRIFKFDCREDLGLKKVGELEDYRHHHYIHPLTFMNPSYLITLGMVRAKDPEYLTYDGAMSRRKGIDYYNSSSSSSSSFGDEGDEILDECNIIRGDTTGRVYPNDPKDICPSCNEACEVHPIAKCPRCRRVARCLEVCHECTLEEEAECLAKKKKAESIAASTLVEILVEIANDDDDSDDNDEGEELQ